MKITEHVIRDPSSLGMIRKKLEKLNKTAAKLGLALITLDTRKEMRHNDRTNQTEPVLIVTVTQPDTIVLAGWEFVARLDRVGQGVVVANISDHEVPPNLIAPEAVRRCDHCRTYRRRNATFVIRSTRTQRYKIVGRQCLKDFTGHKDAEAVASFIAATEGLLREVRDSDNFVGPDNSHLRTPQEIVAIGLAVIETAGWVSRAKAKLFAGWSAVPDNDDKVATADHVREVLFPDKDERKWSRTCKAVMPSVSKYIEEAVQALAHAAALEGTSEYERNIKALATEEWIDTTKHLGLVASIAYVYRRHTEKLVQAEARVARGAGEHIGSLKESITVTGVVEMIRGIEGQFGFSTLFVFTDADGNTVKTFTGSSTFDDVQVGDTITVKGTVKEHGEYKGRKETILSRPKVTNRQPKASQTAA